MTWRRTLRRAVTSRPIRLRLALLYAGIFLAAGAALLTSTYLLLAHSLPKSTAGGSVVPNASPSASASGPASPRKTAVPSDSAAPPASGSPHAKSVASGTPTPGTTTDYASAKMLAYCERQQSLGQLQGRTLQQCVNDFGAGARAAATDQRDRALSDLLDYSLLGLGAMTVLSGVLGWVVAGRALRPVADITRAARRASHRHLGERLALEGPRDEITELADAFDDMLDRLDRAFAGQRRFVANASHELRTPLTVMRTAIDVTLAKPSRTPQQLEEMADEVRTAVDRAERTVDSLLVLARSEHTGDATTAETVDLATAAEDALDSVTAEVRAAGLELHTDLEQAITRGNPVLLERLVSNLVENAVRHNLPGGQLWIRTGLDAGHPFVEAENDGPHIPSDAVSELFEPFRRLDARVGAGQGVGIGLSIVASVAAAHHGQVATHARSEGGLVVRVAFRTDEPSSLPD